MDINNPEMCTSNVQQHAQAGALLVDVRERGDAQALAFDAPEVMHLPFSEMKSRWQELPEDRELLIVCYDGEKSVLVSQFLRTKGFANVSPMRGGILLWMQKGYPVIGKRFNAPADSEQSLNSIEKDQEPWASP
ncbi:MAG: rhodanese-like domain-containing protein [Polaromonas sp.]|uniref:rhodanese-like domain-containing protein n=1 Tax=Polaromonas sp. TaxID=1869339 RepID=UPI00273015BB|nr:rhodanese-like domain-containing protein [Polaromonas sp.]MDP2449620.1 rhodanese-like domain-containing protein [Polaromonas sp.]MDP3250041.1 rhodanese-like domain-containing protein [Polaromonas sp.]MDP3754029.1 rhodanese-like domain-containing protein [Polaromonas sp.]